MSSSYSCPYEEWICKHVAALLFAIEDESVNVKLIFKTITELTKECVDSCFNSFSKEGREFWPISLHVIDYLATVLDVSLPNLWLKYSDKYKRYKEFRKGSKYLR